MFGPILLIIVSLTGLLIDLNFLFFLRDNPERFGLGPLFAIWVCPLLNGIGFYHAIVWLKSNMKG